MFPISPEMCCFSEKQRNRSTIPTSQRFFTTTELNQYIKTLHVRSGLNANAIVSNIQARRLMKYQLEGIH